jgi:hypothetical protein
MHLILPSSVVYKRQALPSGNLIEFLALFRQNILPASRRSTTFIGSKISSAIHHADALALLRPRPFVARLTFSAIHGQSKPGSCDTSWLVFSQVSPCDFFLLIRLAAFHFRNSTPYQSLNAEDLASNQPFFDTGCCESCDTTIPTINKATSDGEAVWEASPLTVHNNSTVLSSQIGTEHHDTVDTSCYGNSSSILSTKALNPIIPCNYGQGNTEQNPNLESTQASSFSSNDNLFSSSQISQSALYPVPGVGWEEYFGSSREMWLQTQYPAADGIGDSSDPPHILNSVGMSIFSSITAGIDHTLEDSWAFYNPQPYPAQMAYPQMTFNTLPSAPGFPFQMYTPPCPRVYCAWPLCMETFTRPGDLERHRQSVHLGIKHHCFWPGCHNNHGKGYVRCDKLGAHQKEKHRFA